MGRKEWGSGCPWFGGAVRGHAIFETFGQTFNALVKGSSIEGVVLSHVWYSDWSWMAAKNLDELFFEAMEVTLNDDCIREILKYFDLPQCLYFGTINQRFGDLAVDVLSRNLRVFPSTVGRIGQMNFRYLLSLIGNSVINISLSLTSFAYFGYIFNGTKIDIMHIIDICTGPQLKKIQLIDFHLDESESLKLAPILQNLKHRGVQVEWA